MWISIYISVLPPFGKSLTFKFCICNTGVKKAITYLEPFGLGFGAFFCGSGSAGATSLNSSNFLIVCESSVIFRETRYSLLHRKIRTSRKKKKLTIQMVLMISIEVKRIGV
jgi:hypothetical protein